MAAKAINRHQRVSVAASARRHQQRQWRQTSRGVMSRQSIINIWHNISNQQRQPRVYQQHRYGVVFVPFQAW